VESSKRLVLSTLCSSAQFSPGSGRSSSERQALSRIVLQVPGSQYFPSVSSKSPTLRRFLYHLSFLVAAMPKIKSIEYFRVPPRWLFVKVTDEHGSYGWGEATLEGHTQAVEGCLDALIQRFADFEAEYTNLLPASAQALLTGTRLPSAISKTYGRARIA
jgi:hypothetical protein